jgi:hypothetical protein
MQRKTAVQEYDPFTVGQPEFRRDIDREEGRDWMRHHTTAGMDYDPFR